MLIIKYDLVCRIKDITTSNTSSMHFNKLRLINLMKQGEMKLNIPVQNIFDSKLPMFDISKTGLF